MYISQYQVSGLSPSTVGGVNVTTKDSSGNNQTRKFFTNNLGPQISQLPNPTNASIPNLRSPQAVAPSETSAAGQLVVPGKDAINGRWLQVLVGGTVTELNDPSGTVKFDLLANVPSFTLSSSSHFLPSTSWANNNTPRYVVIASTGTSAISNTPITGNPWSLRVNLFCGGLGSGLVTGDYVANFNGALVNSTPAATATMLAVNPSDPAPFGLVVAATFGTSDSSNTAYLNQFQVALL